MKYLAWMVFWLALAIVGAVMTYHMGAQQRPVAGALWGSNCIGSSFLATVYYALYCGRTSVMTKGIEQ